MEFPRSRRTSADLKVGLYVSRNVRTVHRC